MVVAAKIKNKGGRFSYPDNFPYLRAEFELVERNYVYNTTFVVEPGVRERWLEVIERDYIPWLEAGGYDDIVLHRVLAEVPEGHFTFALMVGVDDMLRYEALQAAMRQKYEEVLKPVFGMDVMIFSSLLKKIR